MTDAEAEIAFRKLRWIETGGAPVVEIDGGYFGGYVKPSNMKADRIDRRFTRNQSGKRKVAWASCLLGVRWSSAPLGRYDPDVEARLQHLNDGFHL
jgi:hypothetical protein